MAPAQQASSTANAETANAEIQLNTLLQLIPEFDTTNASQVYRFIRSCDSAFGLGTTSQKPILLIYALNKITGPSSSDIHAKDFSDWENLKSLLIQMFSQTKTLAHLNLELQTLFQKPHETVTEYFHRVDLCRNKLIEKISTEVQDTTLVGRTTMTEETALNVFVNGLSSDIGIMLRTRAFSNLSEAANFAIQEEKIRNMNSARQVLHKNVSRPAISTPNYSRNKFQSSPQITPDRQISNPNLKTCNYCKKPGHLIAECKKRAYNNQMRSQQYNYSNQSQNPSPKNINHLNSNTSDETSNPSDTTSINCSTLENLQLY